MQKAFEELYAALDGKVDVSAFMPGIVKILLDYKEIVMDWVQSDAFRENYAKHPFPPLFNPKAIDYRKIPAEYAWELNLPLPPYFDFLFLRSHGSGATGMNAFLEKCGQKFISASNIIDGKGAYCEIYKKLVKENIKDSNQKLYIMIADYIMRGDCKKYFALIPKKPAFYLVRDPISTLKHYLGMKRLAGGGRYFSLTCQPEKVLENRIGYGFYPYLKENPTTESIPYWMNFRTMCFHDTQLIKALINIESDSILYVDMQEILGSKAFDTMCRLAKKFGFEAPKDCDKEFFARRVSDFELGFPLTLYAHLNDLEKLQNGFTNDLSSCSLEGGISLTITTCYKIEEGQNDITSIFFGESIAPIVITASAQDYKLLMQNPQFAQVCSAYLKQFVIAVFAKKDKEDAKRIKEEAVLEYFKEKPFFRKRFNKILEKSLQHLQVNRPDIIESWKYYAEFKEMCKADKKK